MSTTYTQVKVSTLVQGDFLPLEDTIGATVQSVTDGTGDDSGKKIVVLKGHQTNRVRTVTWEPDRKVTRHCQGDA